MTSIHNRYRTQAGLSAQSVDPDLTSVAQRWADHMASVGSMYHGGGEQIIAYSGGDVSYDSLDYNSIFAIGLVLFVVTFVLNFISRRVASRFREVYE